MSYQTYDNNCTCSFCEKYGVGQCKYWFYIAQRGFEKKTAFAEASEKAMSAKKAAEGTPVGKARMMADNAFNRAYIAYADGRDSNIVNELYLEYDRLMVVLRNTEESVKADARFIAEALADEEENNMLIARLESMGVEF
jgi:hypothetical protein